MSAPHQDSGSDTGLASDEQAEAMAHDALVYELSVALMRLDGNDGDPHQLIWCGGPIPEPWGDAWQRYEPQAESVLNAIGEGSAGALVEAIAAWNRRPSPAAPAWAVRVHCSKGERVLRAGMRWRDGLYGTTWEVVEPTGNTIYSPSGLGGTLCFWCKPVGRIPEAAKHLLDGARPDGCVSFCGDSIAAGLLEQGISPAAPAAEDASRDALNQQITLPPGWSVVWLLEKVKCYGDARQRRDGDAAEKWLRDIEADMKWLHDACCAADAGGTDGS